jgi:Metallopeptidase family M24
VAVIAQIRGFDAAQLDRFRSAQRASYAVLEETAKGLEPGVSERETTTRMMRAFRALGVRSFFHLPVALFGARTSLPGKWRNGNFWPTRTRLAEGDAVILDASPIFDGYLVDTSYSTRLGENAAHHQMLLDLAPFRAAIAARVREGATFRAIALETDAQMRAKGYENRHQAHLEEVLGHRALRLRAPTPGFVYQKGFDAQTLAWFALTTVAGRRGLGASPNWNAQRSSDHAPWDGLWAVEPHVGRGALGAKWEELLVIQDGEVFWLDDDSPHTRYWRSHGLAVT